MDIVIIALLAIAIIGEIVLAIMFKNSKKDGAGVSLQDFATTIKASEDNTVKRLSETNKASMDAFTSGITATNEQLLIRVGDMSKNNVESIEKIKAETTNTLKESSIDMAKSLNEMKDTTSKEMATNREESAKRNAELTQTVAETFKEIRAEITTKIDALKTEVIKSVTEMREDNTKQLEKMRGVVDEKLAKTLDERLTNNYNLIAQRLESLNKGLGTLQSLSTGVTDLQKVLTNVKTRGTYGEVSLEAILEDILTSEQFERNVNIKKNRERVDFAVVLPGEKDEKVYLPIDVKFPIEDYYRLIDAENKEQYDKCSDDLVKAVKKQAKSISEKYIDVPKTTDFALMYLPTEGLYSEVVKKAGLIEELQKLYQIVPVGPTNITAMLNSLRIGFRTLAMQKCSKEIYNILGKFNKEFTSYIDDLNKAKENVDKASTSLESATKRTGRLQKHLEKAQKTGEANGIESATLIGLE